MGQQMSSIENEYLKMTVHKIKSIDFATIKVPVKNGVYAFIGNNGIGKSTIIYCLAQLINRASLVSFGVSIGDGDSYVEFHYQDTVNRWIMKEDKYNPDSVYPYLSKRPEDNQIRFNGMYEGSLFFGFRFLNHEKVKRLINSNKIKKEILAPAEDYIVEKLGYILHGDISKYKNRNICRIANRETVKELNLEQTPYFMVLGNKIISQYAMSSGECLLLSLLHFIYYSIVMRSLDQKIPALMLIDEIEVALHPIATSRLLELLEDLANQRDNLIVILTSHSPEVINKLNPRKMFFLESDANGNGNIISSRTPCYPSYAIRDVYRHDGYDYLLLVEDDLAKIVVENQLSKLKLKNNKLIHITPVGGWANVLKLQQDLFANNVLGINKNAISILDGDIKTECNKNKEYQNLRKLFLPIPSIEKYLKDILVINPNKALFETISNNLFQLDSLKEIIQEYKNKYSNSESDKDGKTLYQDYLLTKLSKRKIDEEQFITFIANIANENVDFTNFSQSLAKLVSK